MFRATVVAAFLSVLVIGPAAAYTPEDECKLVGAMARTAMTARQSNLTLSEVMDVYKKTGSIDELSMDILLAAFGSPRFYTDEMQERAIAEFQESFEVSCYRGIRSRRGQ